MAVRGWEIFFFSLIAWIVITLFALLPKKLPITVNLCVYFCTALLMTSAFTTLEINLNRIIPSQRLDFYFCHEFTRYIINPFILLLFTNIFLTNRSLALRFGAVLFTFAAIFLVHYSMVRFGIITFHNWALFYSMLIFIFFMVAAWLLEKIIAHFFRKVEAAQP